MWKHTYPEILQRPGMNFKVMHMVQYLHMLTREGKLKLNSLEKKVAYHDPCDLGRNSGVYNEPREIIRMIPGVEFIELEYSREYATCCGGGGNVESIDAELSSNISRLKAREIIRSGADIVITSCQQCVRTIAQALKKEKSKIKAMDIAQLVLMSLDEEEI
jgi:Fe-S oxidoreductase